MCEVCTPSKRILADKFRILLGLILFVAACLILMNSFTQIERIPKVSIQPIIIAVGIGSVAQSFFALVILLLVSNECQNFRFLESIAVCYVPMLGKYLPGRIWTFSMSFWMYTSLGVSKSVAFQMMTLTIMISLATGLLTAFLSGIQVFMSMVSLSYIHVVGIIAIAFVCILLSPWVLKQLKNRWPHFNILDVSPVKLSSLAFINVLGWGLYGVGFYSLVLSVTPLEPKFFSLCIAIFPLAQLVGFISFMVPAGLGVREAVIVAGLSSITGEADAVMIAIICRIWQTFLELIFALVGWIAFCKRAQTKTSS